MHKRNNSYSISFLSDYHSQKTHSQTSKEQTQTLFLMEMWQYISMNWQDMKKSQKGHLLAYQGIPPPLRKNIWTQALPNHLVITPELYDIFLNQARSYDTQNRTLSKSAKLKSFRNIEIDIKQTNQQLALFGDNSPMKQHLKNLLLGFTFMRPDIGYVQGMSYIGGIFLMYFDEFNSFVRFSNLVTSKFLLNIFRMDFEDINETLQEFEEIFQGNLPELFEHFRRQKIGLQSYVLEWFLTLYSKCLNPDTTCRMWDIILIQGSGAIMKIGVGILKSKERQLMKASGDEIERMLRNVREIQEDELIQWIQKVKMDV